MNGVDGCSPVPMQRCREDGHIQRAGQRIGCLTRRSIRISVDRMRTTLDLPEPLIEEARRLLGFKSKTDTVVLSLKEMIRRKRIEELKDLLGSVRLDIDIDRSRRRPRRRS